MCLSTGSIKLDSFVIRSMRNASGKVKMWYYEPISKTKLTVYSIINFKFYYMSKSINYYTTL